MNPFARAVRLLSALLPMACSAVGAAELGMIHGRFLLHGEIPEPRPLTVDKDVEVCGKCEIPNEQLVVGANRALANVVVYIRSKDIPPPKDNEPEPAIIRMDGCRYKPHVTVVQTGQEVVFQNKDPVGYNPNVATVRNSPSGALIPRGIDLPRTFTSAEAVPVRVTCNIHPWMEAWLVIRPNPYACVSDSNGDFKIANVPTGTWELQFWHEKFGYIQEMTIDGVLKPLPNGRMKVDVVGDSKGFGEIVLDYGKLREEKAEPGVGADSR